MISLDLQHSTVRLSLLAVVVIGSCLFINKALNCYVTTTLTNNNVYVGEDLLELAAAYYPDSSRVQARLAARLIEAGVDETQSQDQIAGKAIDHALRAVRMAPWSAELRVLLSAAREMNGDLAGAESDLREALKLAPNHTNVHWRLANLLLRVDKADLAWDEFRTVTAADPSRLMPTLNLVWQASDGNLHAVEQVAGSDPAAEITLALFLVNQSRTAAAAALYRRVDRRARLELPVSGNLIDTLLTAGEVGLAIQLWRETLSEPDGTPPPSIWNGSFETPDRPGLTHFTWQIHPSRYAATGVTAEAARSGRHSFRIAYHGIETTRLEPAALQMIPVVPGGHYRLECYVKSRNLVTPDGPQVVITRTNSNAALAASAPVGSGSRDWEPLSVEFDAPADAQALYVTIKQTPQFSFTDPTRGTIWFDDFALHRR